MHSGLRASLLLAARRAVRVNWLAALMAAQADGFDCDLGVAGPLFQGTDEATPVLNYGEPIGRANDRRTGPNSPRNTVQATNSFRPRFQPTGAVFDASDDHLITGYTAGAGANFIVAKVTAPATLSSTQVVVGALAGGSYAMLGLTTGGAIRVGLGSTLTTFGGDIRGQTAIIGISWDSGACRVFLADGSVQDTAYAGLSNTSRPLFIGAMNSSGAAANFFGGSVARIVAGRQFLDLDTFNKIAAAL